MSTELRNVPGCKYQYELRQVRFFGGVDRGACLLVKDQKGDSLQLTKEQARNLAVELMLFAEGREVEMEYKSD